MKILEREIGSITFAANQTRTLALPRNYAYRSLQLLLKCNLTRTTTAGTSTNEPKDSAPAQLVKNIMIRANGRDVIKNYDLETLHRMDQLRHGVRPYIAGIDWAGGDDAADKALAIHAQIDFAMWRAIRPIDTLLDSAGLATLELIVTFGSGTDTMDNAWQAEAGAAVTVNSATLYVASVESVGVPANTRFMTNKEYMIRSQVTAASARHQINLPVANLYRSFILKTHSDGQNVHTILPHPQTITIQAGTEVFKYRIAHFLQLDNRLERQQEIPENLAAQGTAWDHYLYELNHEGYYLLEFVKDGRLTECLDTSKLSSLDLILDVSHPGTNDFVDVYPCELIRPPVEVA